MSADLDFEGLVDRYYPSLYQFAFSLTRSEADAGDLTQQTFYTWAAKGHQLRDDSKVKTWLFSTLHHEFLNSRRKQTRFPHFELEQVSEELPLVPPVLVSQLDLKQVLNSLASVGEIFQAPVALFYLEDHSYKEIADILQIPIGTVKSRIARGLGQLHRHLLKSPPPGKSDAKEKHDS